MEIQFEVAFAIAAIIAGIASSQVVETFVSPILARFKVTNADFRKAVFLTVTVIINFIFLYWKDVDMIANLLDQNSYWVTIGLTAFAASGVGEVFHRFKGLFKQYNSPIDIIADVIDEVTKDEVVPQSE